MLRRWGMSWVALLVLLAPGMLPLSPVGPAAAQELAGGPAAGVVVRQAACVPRPRVGIQVAKVGEHEFQVTVTAGRGSVELLRFGGAPTARVDLPGQKPGLAPPFDFKPTGSSPTFGFLVRSTAPGTPMTLPLTVFDGCGPDHPWRTFVGAGQAATLVQVSIADASLVEGDGAPRNLNFAVTLSSAASAPVSVQYATADGTATAPADYAAGGGTLTFAPGETAKTIAVPIVADTLDEPDTETFTVRLSNPVNAVIADGTATGTIVDDEILNDGAPTLSIADVAVAEGNGGAQTLTFTVSLSGPSGLPIGVAFATADDTATAPADYAAASGTLTFAPGETAKPVTVQVVGDAVFEPNERFFVTLSAPTNATISKGQGIGTITNDDAAPTVTLAAAPGSFSENGGQATVTATLSNPSSLPVTVALGFGGSATGPAGPGNDYAASATQIAIPALQVSGAVTLTGVNDAVSEGNETVEVSITGATNATVGSPNQATLTLSEDDAVPTVSLGLAGSPFAEDGGQATVTATLSGPVDEAVTVTLSFGGTATAPGNPNADYGRSGTEIVIPALQASGSITLTGVNDPTGEGNETVIVGIGAVAGGGVTAGAPSSVTATISDDDGPRVTTTAGATAFAENGAPVVVDGGLTVTPAGSPNLISATVAIANLLDGAAEALAATPSGAILAGDISYTAGTGTLTIARTAPAADYQAVLRSVTYVNSSENPTPTTRTISFQVADPLLAGNIATKAVTVGAANDAPVLANLEAGAVIYIEDDPPTAITATLTVADPDSAVLVAGTVQITAGCAPGEDVLALVPNPQNGISGGYSAASCTLVLSGSATPAGYETALRAVRYSNTSQAPSTAARTVTFRVTDGTTPSNTPARTVNVVSINDAPVVTLSGSTPSFTEGGGAVTVDGGLTVADVDTTTLASATATITNLLDVGQETLAATVTGTAITANYVPATGVLTLTGPDTLANFQQVLRTVTYANGSTAPSTAARVVRFVANDGSSPSANADKSVAVVAVDTPPTAVADSATVTEDSGANAIPVLANDADPDGGPISITSVTQPANGTAAITGGGTGLTYDPNANYCNSVSGILDTFTYTLTPGGSSATVTMTVTCVDDNPTAVADSATVAEDSGANAIPVLANDADPDGGPISIASVTQPANGTAAITGGGSGLTYAPNANYCNAPPGTTPDTFTYTLAPGGATATVTVTVTCVPDNPTAVADSFTVTEDSGANALAVLANDANPDALAFGIVSVTQPANGTAAITGGGSGLTYAPNANYCNSQGGGSADTFTYTISPASPGGATATVSVTVTCVNDTPTFTIGTPSHTSPEDNGPQTVAGFATAISDGDPEATQTLTFALTATGTTGGLTFSAAPAINVLTGTLTYQAAANSNGTATFDVTLADNGIPAAITAPVSITITVTAINDPPQVTPPAAYAALANTGIAIPNGSSDLLDGSTIVDPDGAAGAPFAVTAQTVTSAQAAAGLNNVVIAADGSFSYDPPAGFTGTDTFAYQVCDSGTPTPSQCTNATASVTVSGPVVWYVDATAGACAAACDGRLSHPFQTLAAFQAVNNNTGTNPGTGDFIFLFESGTGYVGPVTLLNNQQLIGQDATASIQAIAGIASLPTGSAALPAANPSGTGVSVTNTAAGSDAIRIGNGASATIRGLTIGNVTATGTGINMNTGATTFGTLAVSETTIATNGRALSLTSGTLSGAFASVTSSGGANNVLLNGVGTSGTFAFGSGALSGATGDAFSLTGGTGTFTYGGTIANTAARAISVSNTAAGGSVSFTTTAAGGISSSGSGSGVLIDGAAGSVTVGGAAGPAGVLSLTGTRGIEVLGDAANNATGTFTFNHASIDTAAGASNHGVLVDGDQGAAGNNDVNATIALNDVDITHPGGQVALIRGLAGGTVTFDAASTIARTDGGLGILVDSNAGGTITFGGSTKTLTTNANPAVTLTNNTGTTVNFTNGSLAITTTGGAGFSATGGGTVTVQGTGNTITSTTGTALNVANTTIGASGLTFRSISANGAANGIALNTTGAGGGLTVSGNSAGLCGGAVGSGPPATAATTTAPVTADCTGGTIQNTTGAAVVLSSTSNVSLTRMWIKDGDADGIQGTNVTNFALISSLVENNGDAVTESNLAFGDPSSASPDGMHGTGAITSSTIRNGFVQNVRVRNFGGAALTSFTVTDSQITNSSAKTQSDDGMLFLAEGTNNMTISVTDSYFAANRGDHFQAAAANSGTLNVTFRNNTMVGGHSTALGQGLTINAATQNPAYSGRVDYDIDGNHVVSSILSAITVNLGSSGNTAVFDGFVRNNVIGQSGQALSCSAQANGISIDAHGNGTHTTAVTGNTIKRCFDRGIGVLANDGNGALNMTVSGNSITEMSDTDNTNGTPREAIEFNLGATSNNIFGQVDSHAVCLSVTSTNGNMVGGAFKNGDIRMRQRFRTSVRLPGYSGTAFDTAAVITFLQGLNPGATATATANDDAAVTTDGYFGGAACATPS